MSEHDLRACPFCASSDLEIGTAFGNGEPYPTPDRTNVRCGVCRADGPIVETPHNTASIREPLKAAIELAAYKWNDRRCNG